MNMLTILPDPAGPDDVLRQAIAWTRAKEDALAIGVHGAPIVEKRLAFLKAAREFLIAVKRYEIFHLEATMEKENKQ